MRASVGEFEFDNEEAARFAIIEATEIQKLLEHKDSSNTDQKSNKGSGGAF